MCLHLYDRNDGQDYKGEEIRLGTCETVEASKLCSQCFRLLNGHAHDKKLSKKRTREGVTVAVAMAVDLQKPKKGFRVLRCDDAEYNAKY